MSLPTYPFARERYWVETASEGRFPGRSASVLHPLLHGNTSDLNQQRYSSTFSGEEFFLKDHLVEGQSTLPASAYLEMARAAIEKAVPISQGSLLELRDMVWGQAAIAGQTRQINIALLAKGQEQIDSEFYSQQADQETIHCQGRAVWSHQAAPARLDLEQLRAEMRQGVLEAESVYPEWARLGVAYGPGFQSIVEVNRGSSQA